MKIHKIAIIGGTGKSGTYLVNRLLGKGYSLKLLLRNPNKFTLESDLIEIVLGDARNFESVAELAKGCQAFISTLGQPKGEPPIFSQATKNVVKAIRKIGMGRYIVTTGLNVNTPYDKKDEKARFATKWMYENFPETTADKQLEYDYLVKSGIEWTLVRLPLIIQTGEKFPVQVNQENCAGTEISATDLADFLIAQLSDTCFIGKSPFLSNF